MLAWHRLTPKDSDKTNGERYGENLPKISEDYCHLLIWLEEMGFGGHGINGLTPLSFQEIEAWARMTKYTLSEFEASTLRLLSAVYAGISSDPDTPCPVDSFAIQQAKDIERERQDAVNVQGWLAAARTA